MFLYCIFSPDYIFLWPEYGPQWPKHVVSLINRTQRQLCFDVHTPSQYIHQLMFLIYFNISIKHCHGEISTQGKIWCYHIGHVPTHRWNRKPKKRRSGRTGRWCGKCSQVAKFSIRSNIFACQQNIPTGTEERVTLNTSTPISAVSSQ